MSTILNAIACIIESSVSVVVQSLTQVYKDTAVSKKQSITEGFYPADASLSQPGEGADDAWNMFKPYLNQTEFSSREQRTNQRWPTSRELLGSEEQSLREKPMLPCGFNKTQYKASAFTKVF